MEFCYPNKPIRIYQIDKLLTTLPIDKWIVQSKVDGKRVLPYCDNDGNITLYGRLNQKFKETRPELAKLDLPRPWLADGELLRDGRIFLWDYAVVGGAEVFKLPYQERLTRLQSVFSLDADVDRVGCELIDTFPANQYQTILSRGKDDGLEGIVFKNKLATNMFGVTSTNEVPSMFKYRF